MKTWRFTERAGKNIDFQGGDWKKNKTRGLEKIMVSGKGLENIVVSGKGGGKTRDFQKRTG